MNYKKEYLLLKEQNRYLELKLRGKKDIIDLIVKRLKLKDSSSFTRNLWRLNFDDLCMLDIAIQKK